MSPIKIIRIVALLLVLVMAFVVIPYGGLGLAVLGLAIGFMGVPDDRRLLFMVTTAALTLSAGSLGMVPAIGDYLTAIFTNATAVMQAGTLAVFLMIVKERLSE
jgi:hypothetical protein